MSDPTVPALRAQTSRWIWALTLVGTLTVVLASAGLAACVLSVTDADPEGVGAALITLSAVGALAVLWLGRRTASLMERDVAAAKAQQEEPAPAAPPERDPRLFVVAPTYAAALRHAEEAGWPRHRTVALGTADDVSVTRARGHLLQDGDHLVYLDGWQDGPYADEVRYQLDMCDRRTEPAP